MQGFEYKVLAAPARGEKARGAKTTGDRFAHALTRVMNEMAKDGWDYLRADTLPCEERSGFTGRATTFQHMLVFRRALPDAAARPSAARPSLSDTPPVRVGPGPAEDASAGGAGVPRLGPADGKGLAAE